MFRMNFMCDLYLINTKLALIGTLFAFLVSPAYSEKSKLKIELLTEQYYPLNYTESGKDDDPIIGFSTELVKAVMNASGFNYDISMVPWARAVRAIDTRENVIVYSMTRSPDREDKYHWIGEIWPGTIFLYGLKEKFTPLPKSIDEIKHLLVGISKSSVAGNYLQANGFTQLYSVKSTNYLKLLQRGRIDLFPFVDFSMVLIADREGYDRDKIVAVLEMKEISMPLSIAASKQTKPEIVSKLREAYKNTVDSGTYDTIMLPFKLQLATKVYNQ